MLWYMSLYEEAMMKELNIVQDLLTNYLCKNYLPLS